MKGYIKSIAIILSLALILGGCNTSSSGGSAAASSASYKMTEKAVKAFVGSIDNENELPLYFVNDGTIPYISVTDILNVLGEKRYELSFDESKDHAIITRTGTGYTLDFDFKNDTISFFDYDGFFKSDNGPLIDIGTLDSQALSKKIDHLTNDRYGKSQVFDLKKYNIDMVRSGEGYYVPLQTFSDLIMSYNNAIVAYNGNEVFMCSGLSGEMEQEYYNNAASGGLAEDLALFSYNELCLAMDNLYGLKEIHNIESFDRFFTDLGLDKMLKSTDPLEKDTAMYEFITCYLDDLHSTYEHYSYQTPKDAFEKTIEGIYGVSNETFRSKAKKIAGERRKVFPDGVPPYQEVGNTAYISFDTFTDPSGTLDYTTEPKEDEIGDTIRLMQYSFDKITRPGSPVKNVVLDLSLNSGGACAAASYVIGMFLGTGQLYTVNTLTGASTSLLYSIDTNRDGVFDENDTLVGKDLNLYCMISPISFSCGNLVPNVFKNSQNVTLLGMTSGGGSCTVLALSTAYGCMFNTSGCKRMSVFKNGSFYDIDRGTEPDYPISKIEHFYNRSMLTDYINGLI